MIRGSEKQCVHYSTLYSREFAAFILGTKNLDQIIQILLRNGFLLGRINLDTF